MSLEDEVSWLRLEVHRREMSQLRGIVDPDLTMARSILSRLEGIAAPGDAVKQSAADIFVLLMIRYKDEIAAGYYINAETRLAEFVTAAEDEARRATAIKAAHVVRAQQDSKHPATYGEIAKAIMALATEATPGGGGTDG